MFRSLKTLAVSAALGLAGMAALPAASHAEGVYLDLNRRGDVRIGVDGGYHDADYRRDDRRWRDERGGWGRRACTPERALNKAERMGLRRVAIRDVSRRTISVSGRDRGARVVVTFGRGPGCPVVRY